MKSSELSESDFTEILKDHLLPFFPRAQLKGTVDATLYKREELVAQKGSSSATNLYLKTSVNSKYRVELWRSQPFSSEEKKLIGCFLMALAGRDLPSLAAHRRDTLTSIVSETVARFAAPDAKYFVLDLLDSLTEWAQQTYEGERIAFSAGVLNVRAGDDSGIEFSAIVKKDFVKVLSNAQDTLLIFDRNGRLQRHESCANVQFPPNSPTITARRFVPIRFDNFAKWSAQNFSAVIVTLTRHGEILIFRNGDLLLAKRRGVWRYFTHEICLKQITNNALAKKSPKEFREELYLTVLDVAFARKGGCIGVLRKDFEILGIAPVSKQDRLRELSANSDTAKALKVVINNRPFQNLDRLLRAELAGIDGSLVLDYKGNILAVGAILSIKSRSEDGGGRQAAAENLSEYGLGLKISNDGYIRAFGAREEIFTIG